MDVTENAHESTLLRRMQSITHTLTLDLYRQSGPFWDDVAAVRAFWRIADSIPRQIPPRLSHLAQPWDGNAHFPQAPEEPDPYRKVERFDCLHDFCTRWYPRFEPDDGMFSYVFLSGCACYDPPHDDLLGFANHADNLLGSWHPDLPPGERPPPGLPIAWVPDLDALTQEVDATTQYYERHFLRELRDHLLASLADADIDGRALWTQAEAATTRGHHLRRAGYALPTEEPPGDPPDEGAIWQQSTPLIDVRPDTSDADIRAAVHWIRRRFPPAKRLGKRPRDPLVCLQCAIWRDDFGWSEQAIGEHFGWSIQYPAAAKPRCETARQHIAEGRAFRRHES